LIEAAAHRCAIVSTSVGAEGLEFERGAAIRISDTPSDFADEIVAICSDSSLRLRLGSAARDAYAIKYRRESVIQDVIGLVLGCMCRLDS